MNNGPLKQMVAGMYAKIGSIDWEEHEDMGQSARTMRESMRTVRKSARTMRQSARTVRQSVSRLSTVKLQREPGGRCTGSL